MNCTPSRTSRKRFTEPHRRLVALWVVLWLPGCVGQVEVHPDYERIAPRTVSVEPVGNETIHDLHQVSFGGILQRVIVGPETLDVPAILRASLVDALARKGYETRLDYSAGGEEAADDAVREDARCRLIVEEWSSDRVSSASIRMAFRVELDRASTGERLFTGRYRYAFLEESGEPHANDLPGSLAGAVRTALTALPAAPE